MCQFNFFLLNILLIKFLSIMYIRQIVEDYCLDLYLFIAFICHPLWHILASKFSVELANELHNYIYIYLISILITMYQFNLI